jgi:hypothetical protein
LYATTFITLGHRVCLLCADTAEQRAVQPEGGAADPDDIFGLDSLLRHQEEAEAAAVSAQAAQQAKKRRSATTAWSTAQSASVKRQALLDCMQAAKSEYHKVRQLREVCCS